MHSAIQKSPNFRGSFVINYKKMAPQLRIGFEEVIGKNGKIIFENYKGQKDTVMYVLKNSKDYGAAHYIKDNKMGFKYMPEVDTKGRFDTDFPEELNAYLKENKPKVISRIAELMQYIEMNRTNCRAIKDSHLSVLDKFMQKNIMQIEGVKVKNNKGVVTIRNAENGAMIVSSPMSKYGISYIYVKPAISHESATRYAVDKDGNILAQFSTPDGMIQFRENFSKAINYHLHGD